MKNRMKMIPLMLVLALVLFSCDSAPTVTLDIQSTAPGAAASYPEIQRPLLNRIAGPSPVTIMVKNSAGIALAVPGDPMYGRSLYLEGTYRPTAGSDRDFSLAYNTEEEIKLKNGDSVNSFAVAGLTELIIAFRMDSWFDFSIAGTNPDSVFFPNGADPIHLDGATARVGSEEAKLLEVIQENIEESADFGEDSDGDGILEEDEDDD